MNWSQINPVLLSIFSELAAEPIPDVPEYRAQWLDRSREMASPYYEHALFLKITSVVGVGCDEYRREFVDGVLTTTVCGIRKFTLQVRSECTQNTDDSWCQSVLDRIRTRIVFERYLDRLRDEINVSIVDILASVDVPAKLDGRQMSVGTMDFILYGAVNEQDPIPTGWIERVRLSSLFDSPIDTTDVLLPPA